MGGLTTKRKAIEQLEEASKRQRIEDLSSAEFGGLSDEDDEDFKDDHDFSEDDRAIETPATPFSPARKKFPSELKHLKCTWDGCTKAFNRPIRLQNHLKTHTNERTFLCTYEGCDKAYFEDKHLQAHIKGSHTHERKHLCEWEDCGKSFLTATRLRRHIATHEGLERFRCRDYPPCNQTFRKHQTLQRHIRSDHLELAPYPCRYIDPVTNAPCNAGFDGASGLRKHEETAHGAPRFFCANCIIPNAFNPDGTAMHPGFSTNSQLQSHIRKEHTSTVCIFCDKQCSNEKQLQIHVESQHSGITLAERKKVQCPHDDCDKSFTRKSNLDVHVRTVHQGERFICGDCDTSESPGLEDFGPESGCGQDFTSKQYLEDHIRVAHLGLPSQVNGRRSRVTKSVDEFAAFIDDEDDDESYMPKSRKKKRKDRHTAIQNMTGFDDNMVSGMDGTLITADSQPAFGAFPPWNPTADLEVETLREAPVNDNQWQLEEQAPQGGQFWVGGGGPSFDPSNYDIWNQEAGEMKDVIGGEM